MGDFAVLKIVLYLVSNLTIKKKVMIRTILNVETKDLILSLPDDFLGKQIEVIAFVLDEVLPKPKKKVSFTVLNVADELKQNYRFNRIEANER